MSIPYDIRLKIFEYIKEIRPQYLNYKWEKIEKIHLTLKFIGSFEEKLLNDLKKKLSFIENYNKFHFRLTGFNFFYRFKIPQIMWIGLGTSDPLKQLVQEIDNVLTGFSVPPERRDYKSHLTLMRLKSDPGKDFVDAFKTYKIPDVTFNSDKVILMQSSLEPTGSEYKELKVFKLK